MYCLLLVMFNNQNVIQLLAHQQWVARKLMFAQLLALTVLTQGVSYD